jgi:hypothetical protein
MNLLLQEGDSFFDWFSKFSATKRVRAVFAILNSKIPGYA